MALFPGKKSGYPTYILLTPQTHFTAKTGRKQESWKLQEKLKKNVLERKSINIQKMGLKKINLIPGNSRTHRVDFCIKEKEALFY